MLKLLRRSFSTINNGETIKNIGISAHIDSGKTTLTERILYYTGRINAIHEVRGKDGVGAKMDSMALEREKGITIQSAATYTKWGDHNINIIDTPGHVDFTVEVERALRVLDGAILVLCSVGGVQSQSITVDRQMKRYNVPRIAFINKLDRIGANPKQVIQDLRDKLKLNAIPLQLPIGLESEHIGIIDLIYEKAIYFKGENGDIIEEGEIPSEMIEETKIKRNELIEAIANVDDTVGELFLMEEIPNNDILIQGIRNATINLDLVPVMMGSAFKNKGVQTLLDGVCDYLPSPNEIQNECLNINKNEEKVTLTGKSSDQLVALAFKLEEGKFGQLTYVRVYQGTLKRGQTIINTNNNKKIKLQRLVRMHADDMEDVDIIGSGEICAIFGVECSSGDTFTNGDDYKNNEFKPSMLTMFIPDPVMSLAVKPTDTSKGSTNFSKAIQRFCREDPTFRVSVDEDSKETILSGMGELHLEVYLERMRREYNVDTIVGAPQVNYRETITKKSNFEYIHKKQSGGSGQYGKIIGYMEPLPEDERHLADSNGFLFENGIIGNSIPPEYIPAVKKGFQETMSKGNLIGHPCVDMKFTITDGQHHAVDSSELAFRLAARGAFFDGFRKAQPRISEPIMNVQVEVPDEFQGAVIGGLNRRRGIINDTSMRDGVSYIDTKVPLGDMFGYTTELRSATQAKGTFTMEYDTHILMNREQEKELILEYRKKFEEKKKTATG